MTMTQDLPPTSADLADTAPVLTPEFLSADEFDEIDTILDEMRTRDDETPQWEFCEGFMAALICCRRVIPASEYLPVMLAIGEEGDEDAGSFADAAQQLRFMELWTRRWDEVTQALDTKIDALDDEAAYQPEVMDVRGAILALPEEERAAIEGEEIPSFGQVWALGFMFAVEAWPEEWTAPRNKEAVKWLNAALDVIVALTEDDTEPATMSAFDDGEGPPTLSLKRMNDFADAIWAVYNLREMWKSIGPRVETIHKVATPGRNEPCSCGSGKKYKKCCGA
jgi:uncharacterized protein